MSYVEQHMVGGSQHVTWLNSILLKTILVVLFAALLVLVTSGFFGYRYIKEVKTAELATLAEVTAERLSQHLQAPMWAVDYDRVGGLLQAEMSETRIIGLVVRDEDQATLFAAKERRLDGSVSNSLGSVVGDYTRSTKPVVKNDKVIGEVEVYLTKHLLNAEMSRFSYGLAILAALLGVVLTITIAATLVTFVVAPIKRLTHCAEQISNGDLKQVIDVSRRDEIGYLGATIDRMQYSLRLAIQRIRSGKVANQAKLKIAS